MFFSIRTHQHTIAVDALLNGKEVGLISDDNIREINHFQGDVLIH